ncbi:MAG TPA: hypothetical protein VFQ61_33450, partial [Polyangiaceae bacterium]|nr:hypothetical protein [Polyangiaceae bacterium]
GAPNDTTPEAGASQSEPTRGGSKSTGSSASTGMTHGGSMGGQVVVAGESGGSAGDVMGGRSAGGMGSTSAGVAENGGTVTDAGGGGTGAIDCNGVASQPVIKVSPATQYCAGTPVMIDVAAEGGPEPFTWNLQSAGLAIDPPEGARSSITGTVEGGGTRVLQIGVKNGCGNITEQQVTLAERQPPSLTSTSLPLACTGFLYGIDPVRDLGMTEGDAVELSGSSWLHVENGRIYGTPSASTIETIHVSSRATACPSAELDLTVQSVSCDVFPVRGTAPRAFPQPCAGQPYQVTMDFRAKVRWSLPAFLDPGLTIDAAGASTRTVTVHGTPTVQGPLLLDAKNANNQSYRFGYALKPRNACYFAYVVDSNGTLVVLDPVLSSSSQPQIRPLPEQLGVGNAARVVDFAFAPDGSVLLYHLQDSAGSSTLAALDLRSLQDTSWPVPGQLVAYAWAEDARRIAVLSQTSAGTLLGGLTIVPGSPPTITALESTTAPREALSLTWFAGNRVVLRTQSDSLYDALWQAARFENYRAVGGQYSPGASLAATASGLFVLKEQQRSFDFISAMPKFLSASYSVLSPSRALFLDAQSPVGGTVAVYGLVAQRAEQYTALQECDRVVAWAKDRERVACLRESTAVSGLRTFDLREGDSGSGQAIATATAPGTPPTFTTLAGSRRAWSASGKWFAYQTDGGLHIAQGDEPRVVYYDATVSATPAQVALSFSPTEDVLLEATESKISAILLTPPVLSEATPAAKANRNLQLQARSCVEDFWQDPSAWCGAWGDEPTRIRWYAEAPIAAMRASDGTLYVVDFGRANLGGTDEVTSSREANGSWEFQPAR